MTVITRFAPSPTGILHIGGARTALFNWLYARHHGGRFLLRLEDTDRARSTQEAIDAIIDGLGWLGLKWDGDVFHQSARAGRHREIAQELLAEDRDALLAFYDFPAQHWKHIRTTNSIESTFATVRLRTTKTKGCLSRMTALTMVFKLCQSASRSGDAWMGSHQIAEIVRGVKFKDGEKLTERAA